MKHRARVEKTPRTWLSHILGAIKAHAAKPGLHDPKSGPKRDFDIDLDYVVELYEAQDGKCAMSGIPMNTKYNDLCSASIDRIDNEQGHVKGNIIIVCKWVNLGRCHHPIEEFKEVLDSLRSILKEETSSDDFKALLDDPDAPDPLPPAPWDKTTPRRGPGRFA